MVLLQVSGMPHPDQPPVMITRIVVNSSSENTLQFFIPVFEGIDQTIEIVLHPFSPDKIASGNYRTIQIYFRKAIIGQMAVLLILFIITCAVCIMKCSTET